MHRTFKRGAIKPVRHVPTAAELRWLSPSNVLNRDFEQGYDVRHFATCERIKEKRAKRAIRSSLVKCNDCEPEACQETPFLR